MRVLIDGDGCPVVDCAARLCAQKHIPCILLCDTAHVFRRQDVEILTFDKGADSVDFALANRVQPGDIVITQDYGAASICLARNARVLNQDGWEYTPENIDGLLLARHEVRKLRQRGRQRFGSTKKRTAQQDDAFCEALAGLLEAVPGESGLGGV